jgi:hypothetical protein
MPLIFPRSLIQGAPQPDNRTIVTINGKSRSVSGQILPTSYTVIQDPGGLISGSAIGSGNGRYLPVDNGTYTFQITAFGSSSFNVSSSWRIGVGFYDSANGIAYFHDGFTYSSGSTLTAPSGNKSITVSGSTEGRGLFYQGINGPGFVPSVTIAFE